MKIHYRLLLPFLLMAFTRPSPGQETSFYGTLSNVSLALRMNEMIPGTVEKDSQGQVERDSDGKTIPNYQNTWSISKGTGEKKTVTTTTEVVTRIKTTKYSTKEFLTDLVRAGELPGSVATPAEVNAAIKGWSLVVVRACVPNDSDFGIEMSMPTFFAYKKGSAPVNLSEIIGMSAFDDFGNMTHKKVIKEVGTESVTTTVDYSHSRTVKTMGILGFGLGDPENPFLVVNIFGSYSGSIKMVKTKDKQYVMVSGASRLSPLVGSGSYEVDEISIGYLIEGSVGFGAGIVTPDITEIFGDSILPPLDPE